MENPEGGLHLSENIIFSRAGPRQRMMVVIQDSARISDSEDTA